MLNLLVKPKSLKGYISTHPSKSISHRALICASLSGGKSKLNNILIADDTIATINILKKLSVEFSFRENHIYVDASRINAVKNGSFECNESASTLRLMLPFLSNYYNKFILSGKDRLIDRVKTDDLLSLSGLEFNRYENSLEVSGKLDQQVYYLSSERTTQLISGMIMNLAFMKTGTILKLDKGGLESPYVLLTIDVCKSFGLDFEINYDLGTIKLVDGSRYKSIEYTVEGDNSGASNWLAAAIFNNQLIVNGLNDKSIQADALYFDYLKKMNVEYKYENGEYSYLSGKLSSAEFDITKSPDSGPILVAIASLAQGIVIIHGTKKMNYKECNRVKAITDAMIMLGANIKVNEDSIEITGVEKLKGGVRLKSYNDHRIIMALLAISSKVEGDFIIDEFRGVKKSYPSFLDDFERLGGSIEVIESDEA